MISEDPNQKDKRDCPEIKERIVMPSELASILYTNTETIKTNTRRLNGYIERLDI